MTHIGQMKSQVIAASAAAPETREILGSRLTTQAWG